MTHRMETRAYTETPSLVFNGETAISLPADQAKKMSAKQRLALIIGKKATTHNSISGRNNCPVGYLGMRDGQLVELHIYPTNLNTMRQVAEAIDDRAFNPGFCNWATYDKQILLLLQQITDSLITTPGRTVDFESDEAGTKYIWTEANLKPAYKKQGKHLCALVKQLNEALMSMCWSYSLFLYSVTQYSSNYSHRETLGRLFD